jgi:hypothetical protein
MSKVNGARTPIESGAKFHKRIANACKASQHIYQEMVGSINYAAVATRGDLLFTVGLLGCYAADPTAKHAKHASGVKRVLRYLRHTSQLKLCLGRQTNSNSAGLAIYAEADFAGDSDEMKSTSGMTVVDRYGSIIA